MIDIKAILSEAGIPYELDGKHTTEGWVSCRCPHCSSKSFHLGINVDSGACNCWSCGKHGLYETLRSMGIRNVAEVVKSHSSGLRFERAKRIRLPKMKLPSTFGPVDGRYALYLERRGFDVDETVSEWGLMSGGLTGPFRLRLIIPVMFQNQIVTFQGRDITGKSKLRYTGPKDGEAVMTTKEAVYGLDKVRGPSIIVCEGPVDVWKMGAGSVCMFGISYTPAQVKLLRRFSKVRILFDNEDRAQAQARKLATDLASFGADVKIVRLKTFKDPGEMPVNDARQLTKDLL